MDVPAEPSSAPMDIYDVSDPIHPVLKASVSRVGGDAVIAVAGDDTRLFAVVRHTEWVNYTGYTQYSIDVINGDGVASRLALLLNV